MLIPGSTFSQKCILDSAPAKFFDMGDRNIISTYYKGLDQASDDTYRVMVVYFGLSTSSLIIEIEKNDSVSVYKADRNSAKMQKIKAFNNTGTYSLLTGLGNAFNGFYSVECNDKFSEDMVLLIVHNYKNGHRLEVSSLIAGEYGLFNSTEKFNFLRSFLKFRSLN